MLNVQQFRYAADNLAYLVHGDRTALAIDGGAAEAIARFVEENNLRLRWIIHTHDHPDHTVGGNKLRAMTGAGHLDHRKLAAGTVSGQDLQTGERRGDGIPEADGAIQIDGLPLRIYATPGHTADAACFYTGGALITGDTLFNGTVGNCFSGDIDGFYRSIKRLLAFPEATIIYAGHDYVAESLAFARHLEPENTDIAEYEAAYEPKHVRSALAWEKRVNPYLRFNAPAIVAMLREKGLKTETEIDRWRSIMTI